MRRILVVRFGALGDLVLATVLLPALRRAHPGAHIDWVTKQRWSALLAHDPRIDRLFALQEGESFRALLPRLSATNYDLVLDAHANLRSRALCALLPPTAVRRLAKDTFARWLLLRGGPQLAPLRQRLVDRYLDLVGPEHASDVRPRIEFGTAAAHQASELLGATQGWIALAPGARHAAKRWPSERFVRVGRACAARGARVLVVGGPDETDTVHAVANAIEGALEWPADRPLDHVAAALARCAFTVGNDSGLLHLSEAVGTPVLAIFGPTVRAWGYFPLDPRSRVFEQDVTCRPCSKMGERACHQVAPWCLLRTSSDEVGRAALELWETTSR